MHHSLWKGAQQNPPQFHVTSDKACKWPCHLVVKSPAKLPGWNPCANTALWKLGLVSSLCRPCTHRVHTLQVSSPGQDLFRKHQQFCFKASLCFPAVSPNQVLCTQMLTSHLGPQFFKSSANWEAPFGGSSSKHGCFLKNSSKRWGGGNGHYNIGGAYQSTMEEHLHPDPSLYPAACRQTSHFQLPPAQFWMAMQTIFFYDEYIWQHGKTVCYHGPCQTFTCKITNKLANKPVLHFHKQAGRSRKHEGSKGSEIPETTSIRWARILPLTQFCHHIKSCCC